MTINTRSIHLVGLIVVAILTSGCASLSKEECQTADWRTIGYEDGVKGQSQARISAHRKACADHGVAFELESYRSGWEDGIARYCQPGNGYQQGRSGRKYSGVCPESFEEDFMQAYRDGRALYKLESDISQLSNKLTHHRQRLDQIDIEIRDASLELVAKKVPTNRRIVLLDEVRKLEVERSEIKTEIPQLEAQVKKRKRRMAAMSQASVF